MIQEERRNYLNIKHKRLIDRINELVGAEHGKIMSQRDLALILGCSNSSVARWLRGESTLSIETASKICDILGLDKSTYLDYDELFSNVLESTSFSKLNDENKQKVYEYIEYLVFLQNKENKQDVTLSRKKF